MKFKFLDYLIAFLALSFAVWGYDGSRPNTTKKIIHLQEPNCQWEFTTTRGQVIPNVSVDRPLHVFIDRSEPCCEGTYRTEIDLLKRRPLADDQGNIGLFIDSLGGFSNLKINGHPVPLDLDPSFQNIGPIVAIPSNLIPDSKIIRIELGIKGGIRNGFAGFWREGPFLGEISELTIFRDKKANYIKNLPLSFSFIYFTVFILFIYIDQRTKMRDLLFKEFIFCLSLLSLFLLFLSGLPRELFEDWATCLHRPVNILQVMSIFRLFATFGSMPVRILNIATYTYFFAFGLTIALEITGLIFPVQIVLFLSRLALVYSLLYFRRNLDSLFYRVAFIISVPIGIGFVWDGLGNLMHGTSFKFPIQFVDRYISPYLLLISILYLIHLFIRNLSSSIHRQTWEELSTRVAHDIRSPLAAMNMITRDLSNLSEDQRLILRTVSNRIQDIANLLMSSSTLLKKAPLGAYQAPKNIQISDGSIYLVSNLIESVIAEKRFQYRSSLGIQIDSHFDPSSCGLFAKVEAGEFKTVLSNLINNAIEASGDTAQIQLSLTDSLEQVCVQISDQGKGIPKELLEKLGARGATFGKENGSGLGLYHAKNLLLKWSGKLEINSVLNHGTRVTLTLPKVCPPAWFSSKIEFPVGAIALILDDDSSIHQVWNSRLSSLGKRGERIQAKHFSDPDLFKKYIMENQQTEFIGLIDYEFTTSDFTGLDLIEDLKLVDKCVLVTSYAEDEKVIDRSTKIGVKLLPKSLASIIPIEVYQKSINNQGSGINKSC